MREKKIFVNDCSVAMRLDLYLSNKFKHLSRSEIKKLILKNLVLLDGKSCKSSDLVFDGISISLLESKDFEPKNYQLHPAFLPLDIYFEDSSLIVLNKPSGVIVHPGAGTHQEEISLVEGILFYILDKNEKTWDLSSQRPGVVHRLDRDTSGLIVWAKNEEVQKKLSEQFKDKSNKRIYLALLDGLLFQKEMSFESYLTRDPKNRIKFCSVNTDEEESHQSIMSKYKSKLRWAKTNFKNLATYGNHYTLAAVKLYTGRTHQIRVHSESLGFPVFGDPLYNKKKDISSIFSNTIKNELTNIKRQLLHAYILGFNHPTTKKYMEFEAPLPKDFQKIIDLLKPYNSNS